MAARRSGFPPRWHGAPLWAEGRTMAGQPFVCPVLVDREPQLAALRAYLDPAATPDGVALVAGEAGLGKSRLLAELLATPEAAACAQVRAACLAPDRAEPYALVLELA